VAANDSGHTGLVCCALFFPRLPFEFDFSFCSCPLEHALLLQLVLTLAMKHVVGC